MRARDWKTGENPGEDRVRWLCDAGKEELTCGADGSARGVGRGRRPVRERQLREEGEGADRQARGRSERGGAGLTGGPE